MAEKNHDNLIIGGAVLAVLYFGIIRPITNKLGLTQSEKDRAEAAMIAEANNNEGWNPAFYKTRFPYTIMLMTNATAEARAKQIYDAFGFFNDDEDKIYAVFRLLKSKAQLSQLCDAYSRLYKQDLLRRLQTPWHYAKDGLTAAEFAIIAGMVQKLPTVTRP